MEDLNADLFDEDFEDDLEDLELDEEDLDDLQEVLLDDLENDEIDSQRIANTNIWPPVVRRGAKCFMGKLQYQQSQSSCSHSSGPISQSSKLPSPIP